GGSLDILVPAVGPEGGEGLATQVAAAEIADLRAGGTKADISVRLHLQNEETGQEVTDRGRLDLCFPRRMLPAAQCIPIVEDVDGGLEAHGDLSHFGSKAGGHRPFTTYLADFMPNPGS